MTLSSFDIFDTTLIRKCGKPENVFVILAKTLFPGKTQKQVEFVLWRNRVQHLLKGEYNIDDIYGLVEDGAFEEYSSAQLKQAELNVESKMLMANPNIITKIAESREYGYKIAFISDMYLPKHFLRDVLIREGAYQDGDGLYVSNEENARKDTGLLYDVVQRDYSPNKWFHYGDNKHSDFLLPQKRGIMTIHIEIDYNDIEKELMTISELLPQPLDLSILAGISRSARRIFGKSTEVMLAADYVAAAYIPYVTHIIADAQKNGINSLFFISRDGYILQKIAERMPHDDIDLKYLFVSRKSLTNPFFYIASQEELNIVRMTKDKETESYRDDYQNCCGYFSKMGVFEKSVGFVDIGWFGSSRVMINSIRKSKGVKPAKTYYFGQNPEMISSRYGVYDVYNPIPNDSEWKTFVIEEYYSACPWPTTLSYTQSKDNYTPVFKDDKGFDEDEVVKANVAVCCWIADVMSHMSVDSSSLYLWMTTTLEALCQGKYYINWTLLHDKYKEHEYCLRKLSLRETFNYLRCRIPQKITNVDICLDLTWGYEQRKCLNKLQRLYLRLSTMKNFLKSEL